MEKVFKIERLDSINEFKKLEETCFKNLRKLRNAKKLKFRKDSDSIQELIEKQAKLHDEEKELLQKKEEMMTTNTLDPKSIIKYIFPEVKSKRVEKSESSEINESLGIPNQTEENPHSMSSNLIVTSIDIGILQ